MFGLFIKISESAESVNGADSRFKKFRALQWIVTVVKSSQLGGKCSCLRTSEQTVNDCKLMQSFMLKVSKIGHFITRVST